MADHPNRVIVHKHRRVFDDFYKMDEGVVQWEKFNGQLTEPVQRLVMERGDSCAALIRITDTDEYLLANQFRYATHEKGPGWMTELVAGMIPDGADPAEIMRQEIHEEAGYRVDSVQYITKFYASPGGCSERIWLYCAEVSETQRDHEGGGLDHEHEDIQLIRKPLNEWMRDVEDEFIQDAKTILALQWASLQFP